VSFIRRWSVVDRLTHWLLLIGVTIEILSGLPLFSNTYFGFLLPLWTSSVVAYPLHIIAAFALVGAVAIHLVYRLIRRHSQMWMNAKDWNDLGAIAKHWVGLSKDYPELGFHHPGEKLIYWFGAVLGLLATGASGLILWLQPTTVGGTALGGSALLAGQGQFFTLALLLHNLGFTLMTALVAGHFIFSITPGNFATLKAMLATGTVPAGWAQEHHTEWAVRVSGPAVLATTPAPNAAAGEKVTA